MKLAALLALSLAMAAPAFAQYTQCTNDGCVEVLADGSTRPLTEKETRQIRANNSRTGIGQIQCQAANDEERCERITTELLILFTPGAIMAEAAAEPTDYPDSFVTADRLANILASDELCSIRFNQEAINTYIEENVAADDLEFAPTLRRRATSIYALISMQPKTEQEAHCFQVRRSAEALGILQESSAVKDRAN